MGESIVGASKDEDKMAESAASGDALEVSVSFGRFENDSLSWERWSSFSPNKYLEEVEKCSTPGSVAQKKAYFEAHYKKIAARKAELLDQEKQMETDPLTCDNLNCGDLIRNTSGYNEEFDASNVQGSAEVVEEETNLISEVSCISIDQIKEDALITAECQGSSIMGDKEELDDRTNSPKLEKPTEAVLVNEESPPSIRSHDLIEKPASLDNGTRSTPKIKVENVKLGPPKQYPKTTPADKGRNAAKVKKKPVSSVPKSPQISTPRVSRPTSNSTMLSASRSATKKGSGSPLPRSKDPSVGEIKKAAPKSLHMSLSLGPTNSDSAPLPSTRKSLIMEKMGDKDIVKRAFKTFQNNFNQLKSSGEERSSISKQASKRGTELKVSPAMTPRKENEGSQKAAGMERRTTKAASSSYGLRGNERAEKQKGFSKKLDGKSTNEEAEKLRIQSKSKEEKEAEIKRLRPSLGVKTMPMRGFHQGQRLSKSFLDKEGSNSKIQY